MHWLLGGYLGGWYLLLGYGFVRWLSLPGNLDDWWMPCFGAAAYFLLIPSLVFGLLGNVVNAVPASAKEALADGLARGAASLGYVVVLGLATAAAAIVTVALAWEAAALSDLLTTENLGETGMAVGIVAFCLGTVAFIALAPLLPLVHLVRLCRPADAPPTRRTSLLLPLALVGWAAVVGLLGYKNARATWKVAAQFEFAETPATDDALAEWLQGQPGIVAASTTRADGRVTVALTFPAAGSWGIGRIFDTMTLTTSAGGRKHELPLSETLERLGYKGLKKMEVGKPRRIW